jgi:hypothetical protein
MLLGSGLPEEVVDQEEKSGRWVKLDIDNRHESSVYTSTRSLSE